MPREMRRHSCSGSRTTLVIRLRLFEAYSVEYMLSEKMAKTTDTARQFLEKISHTLDGELERDLNDLLKLKQEVLLDS